MLPEYSFESRRHDRALATAGSVLTIGLSIKGWSHSKNQFGERKRLTNLEALAVVISKAWPDAGRVSFFPHRSRRQKESLLAGCQLHFHSVYFALHMKCVWLSDVYKHIFHCSSIRFFSIFIDCDNVNIHLSSCIIDLLLVFFWFFSLTLSSLFIFATQDCLPT